MNERDVAPKLIAYYLPQYHCFPENDEWWGKGFTEWTNVKKAKPLFKNHYQPRVPQNNYYYNLLDEEVMRKQFNLANKYGLYGFCYYHYWFNGKLLMDKPLNIMRKADSRINYCFCWANEPWTRSWNGREKDVIMPQEYGDEKEWESHFLYLLQFFEDDMYIKIDKMPVFIIYRLNNVPNADKMISFWDKRCREVGFNGIYVIEEVNTYQDTESCKETKAVIEFEPMYTLKHKRSIMLRVYDKLFAFAHNFVYKNNLLVYNYDLVWREIIKRDDSKKYKKLFFGAFVDWDNSPRRGKTALIVKGATPEKFEHYIKEQLRKAKLNRSEFVFVNAWNEWGESTYLEPDEKNGYGYLEAIYSAVSDK